MAIGIRIKEPTRYWEKYQRRWNDFVSTPHLLSLTETKYYFVFIQNFTSDKIKNPRKAKKCARKLKYPLGNIFVPPGKVATDLGRSKITSGGILFARKRKNILGKNNVWFLLYNCISLIYSSNRPLAEPHFGLFLIKFYKYD